ncbi:hypothetical protein niasHT_032909 [Heterodera trifolii]|uniref:Uncharacterized protein n=1 Tax=Heterodera trifolii TaxID=157864 RepID=A0ABD2INW0_9BILA
MSDRRKEAEEKMTKAIFISADCWLCVFDLLPASQLGLGIALISHRFDIYVDEHFKTRKRTLAFIRILRRKIGENGTKKMEITNYDRKPLPIPKKPLPKKVVGFKYISINFIDQNAMAFLHHFRPLFASFPISLLIRTKSDRILALILRNIWPMIAKNIYALDLCAKTLRRSQKFVPSILNDFPSLHVVSSYFDEFFAEFPCDDSAMASNGQTMAKWLFAPRQDDVPKLFKCVFNGNKLDWPLKIAALKAAFTNASSRANFIVAICFLSSAFADSVVPFDLTNEFTREQLALKRTQYDNEFLLIRCPIVRNASKWIKWEEEAIFWEFFNQRNRIYIEFNDEDDIGDGLLDTIPGPSDQQK